MKGKKETNYIRIENEFSKGRLNLPNVIGNKSIPSPFTKFGKSLDGILKDRGFLIGSVNYILDGEHGTLKRNYVNDKSALKILYYQGVRLENEFGLNPIIPEDKIKMKDEENTKIDPDLFYDLHTNDSVSEEEIVVKKDKSGLWIRNSKGVMLQEKELVNYRGDYFFLNRNKMFHLDGEIDFEDRDYFFNNSALKKKFVNGKNKIEGMYLSKDEVLDYISKIDSKL